MKLLKNFLLFSLTLGLAQESKAMEPALESLSVVLIGEKDEMTPSIFMPGTADASEWYPRLEKQYDFESCLRRLTQLIYANRTECIKKGSQVFDMIMQGFFTRLTEALRKSFSYALSAGHNEASEYLIAVDLVFSFYDPSYAQALKEKLMPLLYLFVYGIKQDLKDKTLYSQILSAYVMGFLHETAPFKEYIQTHLVEAYLISFNSKCLYEALVKIPLEDVKKLLERPTVSPVASPLKSPVPYYGPLMPARPAVVKAYPSSPLPGNRQQGVVYPQPGNGAKQPATVNSLLGISILPSRPASLPRPYLPKPAAQPAWPKVPVLSVVASLPLPTPPRPYAVPPVPYKAPAPYLASPAPYKAPAPFIPAPAPVYKAPAPRALPNYPDKWTAVSRIVATIFKKEVIRREKLDKSDIKDHLVNNCTLEQLRLLGDFFDAKNGRLAQTILIHKNLVLAKGIYAFFAIHILDLTPEEWAEFWSILSLRNDDEFRNKILALEKKVSGRLESAALARPAALSPLLAAARYISPVPVPPPFMPYPVEFDVEKNEEKSLKRKRTVEQEDAFSCLICHEAFNSPLDIATLSCRCNMFYHHDCLEEWKEKKGVLQCTTCHAESAIVDLNSQKK